MGKKKSKLIILPWCWYCEREFEDEKVLMQHQKAKHFKCTHCPRRLNTAGGLAVHIQQVHKLDPDKIENALPGRDHYDVEIFGMEGIPAPDLLDYRRRKEQELGLAPGSISAPVTKRPRVENRIIPEAELAQMLAAHKALMGAADAAAPTEPAQAATAAYSAAPQTYAAPPAAPAVPFAPPPFPGMPFPPPVPGLAPPVPFAPPGPFPPPLSVPAPAPAPSFVPASTNAPPPPPPTPPAPAVERPTYTNPALKAGTVLQWSDPNLSPAEVRAVSAKFALNASGIGKKRARAEDFL